ncbi:hypothetical protein Moror_5334 [Moniliophthora roreri MCA 2997]|uniref:Uncharacterized protein n=1 Tax=Moniliophthora roreri (strain MCA 2997) TaxID=1381753 RepID=V2YBI9_MONRO|nr:hypothetical protein Moror_5334 [Moniliophthora roreri MCA 2997]
MSSADTEKLASYLSTTSTIVFPIANLSVLYFVYGFYVLLFGTCVYIMLRRQKDDERPNHKLYLWISVILFILSTVFVVVYTISLVSGSIIRFNAVKTQDYLPLVLHLTRDVENTIIISLQLLVTVLLNIAADYMLIHRCYVIWDSKKRVALPLIIASVIINALGIVETVMTTIGSSDRDVQSNNEISNYGLLLNFVFELLSVILNSMVTLLTAGRIWWIYRQIHAQGILKRDVFIQSVSRIILESGSLYPVLGIIGMILANETSSQRITIDEMPIDFFPLIRLSAGIAPTLIIVRAKLGKNVESLQDQVSDIRFISRVAAPGEGTSTGSRPRMHSIGNLSMSMASISGEEQRAAGRKTDATVV